MNHGTALTLVMWLEIVESWKEPGEQVSKIKTSGMLSISRGKLVKPSFIEKASNPKEVFSITNALLAINNISPLPKCSSLMELANGFNNFFVDKITNIRDNIINTHFNGIQLISYMHHSLLHLKSPEIPA